MATLRHDEPAPAPSAVRVASARPFVPEASDVPAVRGAVPLPQERPFSLGQPGDPAATRYTGQSTAAVRPAVAPVQAASLQPRSLNEQARSLPATAFAPTPDSFSPLRQPVAAFSGQGFQ